MRRLRREIDGKPFGRGIEVGHAAAGFKRRWMATLEDCMYLGLDLRVLECLIRGGPVAYFPVKDVVILLFAVLAQNGRSGIEGFVWIYQYRQFLILHLYQFGSIGRCISIFRNHEGYFLRLEEHFARSQHHLLIKEEGGHRRGWASRRDSPWLSLPR